MKKVSIHRADFFVHEKAGTGKDSADFWDNVNLKKWEYQTFKVLAKFLDKGHSYLDIGAWIGPTVLYASQFARHCYALEPDAKAFDELNANVNLNPVLKMRISLFNALISDTCGKVNFGTVSEFGDSMSSLMFNNPTNTITVQSYTLKEFIRENRVTDCNFIKMDIEGAEVIVLPDIRDYLKSNTPALLLSLHPHLFKNSEADAHKILDVLKSCYLYMYSDIGESLTAEKIKNRLSAGKGFTILALDREWPVHQRAVHFLEQVFYYILKKIKK